MLKSLAIIFFTLSVFVLQHQILSIFAWDQLDCSFMFKPIMNGTKEYCKKQPSDGFYNMPILNAVYCYNDNSGLCKAVAGRFEFYFNTFTDEVIGPVEKSKYVDENGYHMRVPVSYNIDGQINYVDTAINLAATNLAGQTLSILSADQINWCAYTKWWPYKSSIQDVKNQNFSIYFYNRQSCIIDKSKGGRQHYNTRFLHNSSLRIDLDMNPTIFAMEDHEAKEIRLVKHKRQHWYEVRYQVIANPTPGVDYFVKMDTDEVDPCLVDGIDGHVFSRYAFHNFSDMCLTDYVLQRLGDEKESKLVQDKCGLDEVEVADYSLVQWESKDYQVLICDLHNLPRNPKSTEHYFKLDIRDDVQWKVFAQDGYTFTASTSIPIKNNTKKVRVITLYASYKSKPSNSYDEFYPLPMMSDYFSEYDNRTHDWKVLDRTAKERVVKNLNYVDDIAYLPVCKTILIIFGPIYSEYPENEFNMQTKAKIGSIKDLGIYELANAFFAHPIEPILYVYHRTNWMSQVEYTCGTGGSLVTAKRKSDKYYPVVGTGRIKPFHITLDEDYKMDDFYTEEKMFKLLNVFKGDPYANPQAPDPNQFPVEIPDPVKPEEELMANWIWIVVGVGVLLILAMCVTFLVTIRRRRKRQALQALSSHPGKTTRSGGFDSSLTHGSQVPSTRSTTFGSSKSNKHNSSLDASPSVRSKFKQHSSSSNINPSPTVRSMQGSRHSSSSLGDKGSKSGTSKKKTVRSSALDKPSQTVRSSAAHSMSAPSAQSPGPRSATTHVARKK